MPRALRATRREATPILGADGTETESQSGVVLDAGCARVGIQPRRNVSWCLFSLFHPIVRSFLVDYDVLHVAFAQARGGNSNKAALFREFLQRGRAHVPHAALFELPPRACAKATCTTSLS